jgi:hypothetical protein
VKPVVAACVEPGHAACGPTVAVAAEQVGSVVYSGLAAVWWPAAVYSDFVAAGHAAVVVCSGSAVVAERVAVVDCFGLAAVWWPAAVYSDSVVAERVAVVDCSGLAAVWWPAAVYSDSVAAVLAAVVACSGPAVVAERVDSVACSDLAVVWGVAVAVCPDPVSSGPVASFHPAVVVATHAPIMGPRKQAALPL